jgi:hypothetical protein
LDQSCSQKRTIPSIVAKNHQTIVIHAQVHTAQKLLWESIKSIPSHLNQVDRTKILREMTTLVNRKGKVETKMVYKQSIRFRSFHFSFLGRTWPENNKDHDVRWQWLALKRVA